MHEKEMNIALEVGVFLEERLTEDITGNHELYLDFDVSEEGTPFVSISIQGKDGVAKLTKLFGEAVEFCGSDGKAVSVPVVIRELNPSKPNLN